MSTPTSPVTPRLGQDEEHDGHGAEQDPERAPEIRALEAHRQRHRQDEHRHQRDDDRPHPRGKRRGGQEGEIAGKDRAEPRDRGEERRGCRGPAASGSRSARTIGTSIASISRFCQTRSPSGGCPVETAIRISGSDRPQARADRQQSADEGEALHRRSGGNGRGEPAADPHGLGAHAPGRWRRRSRRRRRRASPGPRPG